MISCIGITIILVVCIIAGVSYAYWSYTEAQGTANKITSDCLKVSIEDVTDAIDLQKAYPITDEQAAKLTPYTFKITNTCSHTESYTVNLEVMDVESRLSSDFVAVSFNGGSKNILSSITKTTPTYKKDDYTAIEAYNLTSGKLDGGASATYKISLWIDEDVTVEDDAMNKNFVSKISVTAEIEVPKLCIRATTLHTETCERTFDGCADYGEYSQGDTITYGNETVTDGTLTTGDAFDCDVNRDGIYDANTERFYYVSDYFNTQSSTFDSTYATLVYYSNVSNGAPDNYTGYAYNVNGIDGEIYVGPDTAMLQLPTTSQWKNTILKNSIRNIYTYYDNVNAVVSNYSYTGYAARLLASEELDCGGLFSNELHLSCLFLLENTQYTNSSFNDYWLESFYDDISPLRLYSNMVYLDYGVYRGNVGVRPAIDVPKSDIDY